MTQRNYICYKIPKCFNNIFIPIKINIIPPANSAFFSYLLPNLFPTFVPIIDITNVIIPIIEIAKSKFTFKKIEIAKYLRILSPLIIIMYLDIVIDGILKGLDAQVSVMAINVIDCIISIGFIYFFVPILGFSGYIISIFISEVIDFTLSGLKLLHILKNLKANSN